MCRPQFTVPGSAIQPMFHLTQVRRCQRPGDAARRNEEMLAAHDGL